MRAPGARVMPLGAVLLLLLSGQAPAPAEPSDPTPGFAEFLREVGRAAQSAGIGEAGLGALTRGLSIDPEILGLVRTQPEHARSASEYTGAMLSPERVAEGRRQRDVRAQVLSQIEARHGVERDILLAIWGIESSYGEQRGTREVVRSLATLAFGDRRRAPFWRSELIAALRLIDRGEITAGSTSGSWAGALGHTQFMPSSWLSHGVDFNGDGRRDLIGEANDALASAANYLRDHGWKMGLGWGFAVALPAGFNYAQSPPDRALRASAWHKSGVKPRGAWPSGIDPPLTLLLPAGAEGPAFLLTANFEALLAYNRATLYALSVGLLADHIGGRMQAGELSWPVDDRGLSLVEREDIQRLLTARGYDVGGVDAVLGPRTRSAIRDFQAAAGLPADGHPSVRLLERLRVGQPP